MGLLDAAKEEANNYVSPKDFLCFLAYRLGEPIKDVVSFLLYNKFDELACEYYIDNHYRIYTYDDVDCEYKTSKLFKEISKDGYFDYIVFCYEFYDDSLDNDEEYLDFYEPMEIDFFYSIKELQSMNFIKELNLPLEESSALDYSVDDNDMVTLRERKDGIRIFSLIKSSGKSDAERAEEEQELIDTYGENSQAHNIYRVIDMASRGELPQQKKEIKSDKQVINELQEQVAQLTAYHNKAQDKIADLENQLAQAKAELADNPADEVELNPKTQTAVTRLLNVLFHKAQLDITAHKGTTNKNIVSSSISLNAKITEKPVSHWIKQVQQLRIDTEKR